MTSVDLRPAAPAPEDPILALLHNAARSLEAITQTRQVQLALEYKVEGVNAAAVQDCRSTSSSSLSIRREAASRRI